MSGILDGGRHDWLGYLQPTGLVVAPAVLARLGLWPEPQRARDGEVVAVALDRLAGGEPWPLFRDVLGWPAERVLGLPDGPPLPDRLTISLREGETLLRPDWAVRAPSGDPAGEDVQLLVRIEEPGVVLDRRGALDGWEATAQQRFERLLRETGVPAGVLVGLRETGRKPAEGEAAPLEPVLRLVVAPKGEASGHASWPLPALAEVSGRGMLAGLKLLLDAHALFTGAPSHRLPTLLAESRAAQAAVSARLAGQVLASLHELLRGLDAAAPGLVRGVAARDPHQLYEGLLTVLLRLIFILYTEDRGLMPSAEGGAATTLYEQGYALGGLHVRLLDDQALNPDTMDDRRGAWGRLLALFRLVERGHPSGFMQARGGKLFDGGAFPFLLGRSAPGDPEQVLSVSDGCVLRVLDGLLTLDGERVAYRSLSVEQIGSVYETVMGFTVELAGGPTVAIRAGKANKVPVWVDLAALAQAAGTERARLLKAWTGRGPLPAAVAKALRTAADVATLTAALAPVIDARASPRGAAVAAGTPTLQPTDERRRTGSHYTPRSLTAPIVRHALEASFARIGPDATPGEVLDLKVCDPAVGSGAFLVEACRQLGDRLVEAWERWPAQRPTIPPDEDALLHAKRLVAQHCLHGIDRNPLALDLAKLSLWLETLASRHEFTFLDHVLRHGDSLVGLPNPKITAVTWGKVSGQHTFIEGIVRDALREAADLDRLIRAEAEIAPYAAQEARYRKKASALHYARLIADAVLEAFFGGVNARERAMNLVEVQQCAEAPSPQSWGRLAAMGERLHASPIGITGFHWELEFEGVFSRVNPGFDAIVGNPPFAGKNTIASGHPLAYPDWLKTLHPGAHGNADLSAHFFRRAYGLLRRGGAFGLIATNTIRQGDTRATGLERIVADGGIIYRAVSRHRWEGEAAVVVSQVFVRKGPSSDLSRHPGLDPESRYLDPAVRSGSPGQARGDEEGAVLDGRPVRRISAYLVEGDMDGSPATLRENAGKSFAGYELGCDGFLFSDKAEANPIALGRQLAACGRYKAIVQPYLGTDEVNNDPRHLHERLAMNFGHMPLMRAEEGGWASLGAVGRSTCLATGKVPADYPGDVVGDWPDILRLVEAKVKPFRSSVQWWHYRRTAGDLMQVAEQLETVLVTSRSASPHLAIARVSSRQVLAKTLAVFAFSTHAAFATLQSRVHEVWARFFASSMKDDLRYTPSDCFETFPLPPGYAEAPDLEAAGQAYHDHRAALMIARGQGMTPTYNRFHARAEDAGDIVALRRLHGDMDRAVLRAYGWDDLAERAAPVFLDEGTEDDHQYQGRLFWPAAFRDELLARLLRLNEQRAAAERSL